MEGHMKLCVVSGREADGIAGVAVEGVEMRGNPSGAGGLLKINWR